MSVAWRNLFKAKTRLVLNIGGATQAVMLILLLRGFLFA